ncbi:hypothetical protein BDZ91DRAFT_803186 [Kalaharituber pfeilii]|nr:hypothetical protein BDZ91DRAFT_803186 [Kalaharituber pfeilii]
MSSTGPAGGHGPIGGPNKARGMGSVKEPSEVHGHYQYMKGVTEDVLGSVTKSSSLKAAGKADQAAGLSEIRTAKGMTEGVIRPVGTTSHSDTTVVGGGPGASDIPDPNTSVDEGTRQGPYVPRAGTAGILSMEGKSERLMGKMVGCKGMQEEGDKKVETAEGLKRAGARGGGSGGIEGL